MDAGPLQLTLREMQRHLTDPRALGTMAVVAVLLGVAGPFGTFETLGLLPRLAFWVATVFLTYGFGYAISFYADARWGKGRSLWHRFVIMLLPSGIGATLIVSLLNLIAFGTEAFDEAGFLVLLGECFAVATGVVAILLLAERGTPPAAEPSTGPSAILERVPLPQRGTLLALVVEDHYVDIVTDKGKTLVLMRLADAMREASGVPGLQVHRSHWVARDAVAKVHRSDGRLVLELRNGLRLPVSRSYLAAAKAAGLS